MTIDEIAALDDNKLRRYFEQHARWLRSAPVGSQYHIKFKWAICAGDTAELWNRFKKSVDEYRKEIK